MLLLHEKGSNQNRKRSPKTIAIAMRRAVCLKKKTFFKECKIWNQISVEFEY